MVTHAKPRVRAEVMIDPWPALRRFRPAVRRACGQARGQSSRLILMLFMVIENFKRGDPAPIDQRFRSQGRMLPDGVIYHSSWMETNGARCFQLMEAAGWELLRNW